MFKRNLLHCSFCGKDENQVAKLVAGPNVYICDACVAEALRIMQATPAGGEPLEPAPKPPQGGTLRIAT